VALPDITIKVRLEPDSAAVLQALSTLRDVVEDVPWREDAWDALVLLYKSLQWPSGDKALK
jgi:hypothetical protein